MKSGQPRLLVITYHFPPDPSVGGLRWAGLAKHLVRRGCEVHILTHGPKRDTRLLEGIQVHGCARARTVNDIYVAVTDSLRGGQHWATQAGAAMGEVRMRGTILGELRRELASLLAFPDHSRGWMLRAGLRARDLARRFEVDVVVTSGPPHSAHVAGVLATLRRPVPLLIDLRDPWSEQSRAWQHDPVYGTAGAKRLTQVLERTSFGSATTILANTQELAERVAQRWPQKRVHWVPNGTDLEALPTRGQKRLPGLALAYSGTLYGERSFDAVLAALARLSHTHPEASVAGPYMRVAGYIDPPHAPRLQASLERTGLTAHVVVLGRLPRREAMDLIASSRLALVLAQEQELQVPAKLYECVGIGTPTLVITELDSATAREAQRLGALVRSPSDIAGITDVLCRSWRGETFGSLPPRSVIGYSELATEVLGLIAASGGVAGANGRSGTAARATSLW